MLLRSGGNMIDSSAVCCWKILGCSVILNWTHAKVENVRLKTVLSVSDSEGSVVKFYKNYDSCENFKSIWLKSV